MVWIAATAIGIVGIVVVPRIGFAPAGAVLAAVALELGLRFRSGSHPAIRTTGEPR
jgi:hypothetical protein